MDRSSAPYECKSMDMTVSLVSDMERGSMQFVLGAVYSAIVTYGVDSGRLAEIKGCMGLVLPPDIQWYFLCVVAFWAFIRWCSRKDQVKMKIWDKIAGLLFMAGSAMIAVWLVFTFVIFRIEAEWAKVLVASLPSGIAVYTFNGALEPDRGKIEDGETSFDAAYRELYEETGITDKEMELICLMDMVYYQTDMKLEIFGGILNKEVTLVEEFQTLSWIDAKEDFFDCGCFAGDGNIGHIVRMMEKMTDISC